MGSTAIQLAAIAAEAGDIVMRHYRAGAGARWKDDRSPVTDADEEAEAYILKALADLFPRIPVAAEEAVAAGRACDPCAHFFLVDPLDGTREFLKRNGEFTVNIAEVRDGVPVAGAVYAPVVSKLFFGDGDGAVQVKAAPGKPIGKRAARRIYVRTPPARGWVAATSRSHPDPETGEFLKRCPIGRTIVAGSSLKFCLVATGVADIYARAGRTMEWDTAAGHAVLTAAGGEVTRWDGAPFLYGKPGFENGGFVARAR